VSSAFLYLAIVAIWVGVLIPRWLKRDSSQAKAAKSSQPESPELAQSPELAESPVLAESPEATESPDSPDELADDEPVEVNAGADAGRTGLHMADGHSHVKADASRVADAGRAGSVSGVVVADEAGLSGYEPGEPAGLRPSDPQTRGRVLSARRRMLMMLIVLAAAAVGIAVTGLAAWWVAIPPTVMLGGYVVLLREVKHADSEHALIRAAAEHRAEQRRLREARDAAAVKQREEAWAARVIDISERVRDELYDQYAEGERRAVGD
jgi:hypothetical protein